MLLVIDCGNTNTGFAVFDGDNCIGKWRTSTNANRTADEYAVWLTPVSYTHLTLPTTPYV